MLKDALQIENRERKRYGWNYEKYEKGKYKSLYCKKEATTN